MRKRRAYHDGYAALAAAIVHSGEQCNDEAFLHSDWCDTLIGMCKLDEELHPGNTGQQQEKINWGLKS